jgi:hypothetical protein
VDVVSEGEAPKGEDHLSTPARVVGGRRVQHDGHEGPYVVNPCGLGMESGDGLGVESGGMGEHGDLPPEGWHSGRGRCVAVVEETLGSGQLSGQGLPHSLFLLPSEGHNTLTLMRCGHNVLDGGDGSGQRGVGNGRPGSPSDDGDRWATGLKARGGGRGTRFGDGAAESTTSVRAPVHVRYPGRPSPTAVVATAAAAAATATALCAGAGATPPRGLWAATTA